MRIIDTERVPIKSWCGELDEECLTQAKNLANLPFVFKHVCLMPDAHVGYGMPIGGVVAIEDMIIPNAVGVDIGCGMSAVKTSMNAEQLSVNTIKNIMGGIRSRIPLGFEHRKHAVAPEKLPKKQKGYNYKIVEEQEKAALKQLGTLGGGNHFIEVQKDADGFVWVMLHSGSRNVGLQVARYYNDLAKKANLKRGLVSPAFDLAPLVFSSEEGQEYFREMKWCVDFAFASRKMMMEIVCDIFSAETKASFEPLINIAHNYASEEKHFGRQVIVHRKGAVLVTCETTGLIPGSQGTPSYVVRGKGAPESFNSCSHGAGRRLGRKEAIRSLDLQTEIEKLDKKGIIHAIRNKRDLEEASSAYKNIDKVMKEQEDLVEILVKLEPLAVIKG